MVTTTRERTRAAMVRLQRQVDEATLILLSVMEELDTDTPGGWIAMQRIDTALRVLDGEGDRDESEGGAA